MLFPGMGRRFTRPSTSRPQEPESHERLDRYCPRLMLGCVGGLWWPGPPATLSRLDSFAAGTEPSRGVGGAVPEG